MVTGVDHIIKILMKRYNSPGSYSQAILDVRPNEIIEVKNDPDQMEKGFILFNLKEVEGE